MTSRTITSGACHTVPKKKRTPTGSVFLIAKESRKRNRRILQTQRNRRIDQLPQKRAATPVAARHPPRPGEPGYRFTPVRRPRARAVPCPP
ncbi:MAG: hypothetical protein AW07_04351 [Candidatus Accumulibacter sp. SK-11]|nr:MAG: hypothetical protein AW07_04351 [Candidatus Accumulibacter sp. SK-11]